MDSKRYSVIRFDGEFGLRRRPRWHAWLKKGMVYGAVFAILVMLASYLRPAREAQTSGLGVLVQEQSPVEDTYNIPVEQADIPGHAYDPSAELSSPDVSAKIQIEAVAEMSLENSHDISSSPIYQVFPSATECDSLNDYAEALPDIIHIPFEDAIEEVALDGWEDQWLSTGFYDVKKYGNFSEPKIDFVYTWVNGTDKRFQDTKRIYEENSALNTGNWIATHGVNRYRDWNELKFSVRSADMYAATFLNRVQVLVNSIFANGKMQKQEPVWANKNVEIYSQDDFFEAKGCLPTFNSLSIESQIHNTPSDTDRMFAMSDDMILGRVHSASDIWSPLFGPTMGFKYNGYNKMIAPDSVDAQRFGEKPFLIYTSWLLNRRFGERKRKGQAHFGHSLSRNVTREALSSFPSPALKSAAQRFRGEDGFQIYTWYAVFHYTIERHREALLWSYIMQRSDVNGDGYLSWEERQLVIGELEQGMRGEGNSSFRDKMYYRVPTILQTAGLQPPKANTDILWTSLDGPVMINDVECFEFDADECLSPGFASHMSDRKYANPVFSTATIFDRLSRQTPRCGDCLIKLLLNNAKRGLQPLLPKPDQPQKREMALKALKKYQYAVIEPDASFVMVSDAEQAKNMLIDRILKSRKEIGQVCMNDDVYTEDEAVVQEVRGVVSEFLEGMQPLASRFET